LLLKGGGGDGAPQGFLVVAGDCAGTGRVLKGVCPTDDHDNASTDHDNYPAAHHSAELPEHRDPVIDVLDCESKEDEVDRGVAEPIEWVGEVVAAELRTLDPSPAQLDHPAAVVDARHLCPSARKLLGVQARTAGHVEHLLGPNIAQQGQAGWPVVVGVVEAGLSMVKELVREVLVLLFPADRAFHEPILSRLASPTCTAGDWANPFRFRNHQLLTQAASQRRPGERYVAVPGATLRAETRRYAFFAKREHAENVNAIRNILRPARSAPQGSARNVRQ
jgi:hypothetical protein